MATWHQNQRPIRLFHDTLYTVVSDPPNDCRALTLCSTREQAEQLAEQLNARHYRPKYGRDCAYVLRPATA